LRFSIPSLSPSNAVDKRWSRALFERSELRRRAWKQVAQDEDNAGRAFFLLRFALLVKEK